MKYWYLNKSKNPVLECPECNICWDTPNGIILITSIDGHLSEFDTHLTRDGRLIDVDRAVENGYHSETICGGCTGPLIEMDGVIEYSSLI